MGEEKKDSLHSVMDAVADTIEDYGEVVEEYAYQKAQLEMYRWILWGEHDDGKMAERLFGIKRHKHGNTTEKE